MVVQAVLNFLVFKTLSAERLPAEFLDKSLQPISVHGTRTESPSSSLLSIAEQALGIPANSSDDLLDALWHRDFGEEHFGSHDFGLHHGGVNEPFRFGTSLYYGDLPDEYKDNSPHDEHDCGPEGLLHLNGSIHILRKLVLFNCRKVVADGAEVKLEETLQFESDVELEGRLSILGAEGALCFRVLGHLRVSGSVSFRNCHGRRGEVANLFAGGAIHSRNVTISNAGSLRIQNCSSDNGGGIFALSLQLYGSADFLDCSSSFHGGGICVTVLQVFTQSSLKMQNCSSSGDGGSISAENFTQMGGVVDLRRSKANLGGSLWSKHMILVNGSFRVQGSFSDGGGGGLFAEYTLKHHGGTLELLDCMTQERLNAQGGCVRTEGYVQTGGVALFQNCRALATLSAVSESQGGAIFTGFFIQKGGLAIFKDSWVQSVQQRADGGGIYADQRIEQHGGWLTFQNCSAPRLGGAVALNHYDVQMGSAWIQSEDAVASFDGCFAGHSGGAVYSSAKMSLLGKMTFHNSSSDRKGGALRAMRGLTATSLSFSQCHSGQPGAAFAAGGDVEVQEASFEGCNSEMLWVIMYVEGNLTAGRLNITGVASDRASQHVAVGGGALVGSLTCAHVSSCDISAVQGDPKVQELLCPPGHGLQRASKTLGCEPCEAETMSLFQTLNAKCQPCPEAAELCLPKVLKMPPGMTIDPGNFSLALHCPNPIACRGGKLAQEGAGLGGREPLNTSDSGEVAMAVAGAMCSDGYAETACWKCASGYGMTDANPLLCVRCSPSALAVSRSLSFYLAKDAWPFFVAVGSALTARGKQKQSPILLNQLMAFGVIAQHIVNILTQTQSFKHLHSDTRTLLGKLGNIFSFAQGEGDAGSGEESFGFSRECLLRTFGLPSSLGSIHVLATFPPICFMALVAVKHPALSLTVGANVFLPAFAGAFGKYLIGFSLQSKERTNQMAFTTLSRPFWPDNFLLGAVIYLILPICFLGTCLWWSEAIRAKHQTEGPQSPEIFYLTRAYKPEWRLWEIERFLRKMSLSLVATSMSVTYWDSVHLFLLFGILLSSLLLIAACRPYKLHRWNVTEAFLLTTALVTISLVTMLQGNEAHWATDLEAGKVVASAIILLLVVICGNMMLLVMVTLYQEWKAGRQQRPSQDAEVDEDDEDDD